MVTPYVQAQRDAEAAHLNLLAECWPDHPDIVLGFVRLASMMRAGRDKTPEYSHLEYEVSLRVREITPDNRTEEQRAVEDARRRLEGREDAWGVPAELRGRYTLDDFPQVFLADRSPAALVAKAKFYAQIAQDRRELARAARQASVSAAPAASTPMQIPAPVEQPTPAKPARPPRPTFLRGDNR
ncbi:MAG TPA: hypothetical protein VNR89_11910 [Roseomonas sp.]|nr:hypothetical protein [Roseomonas sp.]